MPRSNGPFDVLETIRPNGYKLDLTGGLGVFITFNVADMSPYQEFYYVW